MPRFVCYHDGLFFEWSTIVDAPVSRGMTRDEFETYYALRHGADLAKELAPRMERAMARGTSSLDGESLSDLVQGNRAGPGEAELSFDEVMAAIRQSREMPGSQQLSKEA